MNSVLIFISLFLCSDAIGFYYPPDFLVTQKPYSEKLDELLKIEGLGSRKGKSESPGSGSMKSSGSGNTNNQNKSDPCSSSSPDANSFKGPKIGSNPIVDFEDLWAVTKSFIENKVMYGRSQVNLRKSILWRRDTTQLLIEIFQKVVGRKFVPDGVLHVARELVLVHFEGVQGFDKMKRKEIWDRLKPQLQACKDKLIYLKFVPPSEVVNDVVYMDSPAENNYIVVPEEYADMMPTLDLSIETLWYLFSFSMGACYTVVDVKDRLMWAIDYFQAFQDDFIQPIVHKWNSGFTQIQQGIMFGDTNILQAMKNLRKVVSGIYAHNNIIDRQLNRPMSSGLFNKKTGRLFS